MDNSSDIQQAIYSLQEQGYSTREAVQMIEQQIEKQTRVQIDSKTGRAFYSSHYKGGRDVRFQARMTVLDDEKFKWLSDQAKVSRADLLARWIAQEFDKAKVEK